MKVEKVPLAAIIFGFSAFLAQAFLFRGFFPDDLFMFLSYAKHMLEGGGWSFNYGSPSNGITSPVWLLLNYATGSLGMNLYHGAKLLSMASGLGFLALCLFILNRAQATARWKGAAFIALCLSHWLPFWSASGMEAGLSAFLLAGVAALNLHPPKRVSPSGIFAVSVALLSVSVLTRPETLLFLGLYGGFLALANHRSVWKGVLWGSLVGALIAGTWIVFAHGQFGSIIPNTIKVKQGLEKHLTVPHIVSSLSRIVFLFIPEIAAAFLLAPALMKNRPRLPASVLRYFLPVFACMLLVLPALYFYNGAVGGHSATSRYMLPVLPMATFCLVYLLAASEGAVVLRALALAALVVGHLALMGLHTRSARHNERYMALMKEYSLWIRDNTPPGTAVAAEDYGMVAYYSDRKVVDLVGLHYMDVLKHNDVWSYLHSVKPEYILINGFYETPFYAEAEKIGETVLSNHIHSWNLVLKDGPRPIRDFKLVRLDWSKDGSAKPQ